MFGFSGLKSILHPGQPVYRHFSNLRIARLFRRAGDLTLDEILEQTVTREGVPSQMLNMAKGFDLDKADIAQPNWRAVWIVENCNSCWAGEKCFRNHDGMVKDDAGLISERCPNFAIYHSIVAEKQAKQESQEITEEFENMDFHSFPDFSSM